jgi:probable poly-beta-1,6-N-acetyl-D-glucosamine export protein
MGKKRDRNLDIVRGLGMIGIVLIHVHSYFTFFHNPHETVQIFTLNLANLSRFSVPVFIFSAGYFCRNKSFLNFWKPKLFTIFIPYFLASLVGYFVKYNNYDLLDFFYRILFGSVFTPFYFIPLLMQFYLLYYVLVRHFTANGRISFLFFSLLINIASNEGHFAFFPREYFVISPTNFIFPFALGVNLSIEGKYSNIGEFFKEKILIYTNATLFFISSIAIVFLTSSNLSPMSNHTIIYPTLALFGLYSFKWARIPGDALAIIGKNSMGIFLLHPFVIHFMHSFDPYILGGAWLSIPGTLALNIFIPLVVWLGIEYLLTQIQNVLNTEQ